MAATPLKKRIPEDESLDDLILGQMKLWQSKKGYRFSIDAVLLAHFPLLDRVDQVVDLGTGSGVIPLLLAYRKPGLKITGLELQKGLAQRARRSVAYNRLEQNIRIIEGDIKNTARILPGGRVDLVTSNPPYWKKGEGKAPACPETALARHELAIDFNQVVEQAGYLLAAEGCLALIQRSARLQEALQVMQHHGLKATRLRMIHSFPDQAARLFLLEGKKTGAETGLDIRPPLFIYQGPGKYCEEINAIYRGEG